MSQKLEVKEIFDNYFICKQEAHLICFSNGQVHTGNPFYIFYRDVEIAYYSLTQKERFYFDNEFLYKKKTNWWTIFFSRDEYLSLQKMALTNFLNKFHEIH